MVAIAHPTTAVEIEIVGGLIGLEQYTRYRMISEPDDIACWLEAVDEPAITLPCADAWALVPDYAIEIADEIADELELTDAAEARILLVVQHWDDPNGASVSANGPIVLNTRAGRARQLVVPGIWRISLV